MRPFDPSHLIIIVKPDGSSHTVQVMAEDECLYTQEEWENCDGASVWAYDDKDGLLWDGLLARRLVPNGGYVTFHKIVKEQGK
jgi:hypothetical protein